MNPRDMSFRPLAESDMEMLCGWLNRPHMRAYYQSEPISLSEVRQKYSPRLSPAHPTHCHIAIVDGRPVGKFQCYRVRDFPEYAAELGANDGVSLDLFLGEESCLGRGLGRALLRLYLADVIPEFFPAERICYICHAEGNEVAIRCSLGAGFTRVRNVIESGRPSVLFARDL